MDVYRNVGVGIGVGVGVGVGVDVGDAKHAVSKIVANAVKMVVRREIAIVFDSPSRLLVSLSPYAGCLVRDTFLAAGSRFSSP